MSTHVMPQVHFEQALYIYIFSLLICLWVEARWELEVYPQHLEQLRLEAFSKLKVSIAYNALQNSLNLCDMLDEETDRFISFAINWWGDESCVLVITICYDQDITSPFRLRQSRIKSIKTFFHGLVASGRGFNNLAWSWWSTMSCYYTRQVNTYVLISSCTCGQKYKAWTNAVMIFLSKEDVFLFQILIYGVVYLQQHWLSLV